MQNDIQMRLAENLRRIRKSKRLTQFELAEKSDISEGMIKSIEICHAWPSEKTLFQISNALETDIYHFFIPIESSFDMDDTIQAKLKETVKKSYCEYLEKIMSQLS